MRVLAHASHSDRKCPQTEGHLFPPGRCGLCPPSPEVLLGSVHRVPSAQPRADGIQRGVCTCPRPPDFSGKASSRVSLLRMEPRGHAARREAGQVSPGPSPPQEARCARGGGRLGPGCDEPSTCRSVLGPVSPPRTACEFGAITAKDGNELSFSPSRSARSSD